MQGVMEAVEMLRQIIKKNDERMERQREKIRKIQREIDALNHNSSEDDGLSSDDNSSDDDSDSSSFDGDNNSNGDNNSGNNNSNKDEI